MENYVDADIFLKQLEHDNLSAEVIYQFQRQFERLVVLDYIIRNTGKKNSVNNLFRSILLSISSEFRSNIVFICFH